MIEKDLESLCKSTTSLDITEDLINPWLITHTGDILKFNDLTCTDYAIQKSQEHLIQTRYVDHITKVIHLQSEYTDHHSNHGGWDPLFHARFEKIRNEYRFVEKNRRHFLFERLQKEFPTFTKTELQNHEDWCIKNQTYRKKLHSLNEAFVEGFQKLHEETLEVYKKGDEQLQLHLNSMITKQLALEKLEENCEKLRQWRIDRMQELLHQQELKRKEEALQEKTKREERQKQAMLREQEHLRIQTFRQIISQQAKEAMDLRVSLLTEHKQTQLKELEDGRKRCQQRAEKYQKRLEERKRVEVEAEEAKREAERRLDALRATVAVNVEADWDRILKPTESFKSSLQFTKLPSLFKNDSFSNDDVFRDKRAKISQALFESGLGTCGYAQDILRNYFHTLRPVAVSNVFDFGE
ncbi:hypothetical protein BC829DRAFT_418998 [Chytridium lagenaria]|nr:hypothetical protein BC829DRAFT_418998 [Chytridium lagenaria]